MKVFAKFGPEGMKDQENRELGKIELERNGIPVTRRLWKETKLTNESVRFVSNWTKKECKIFSNYMFREIEALFSGNIDFISLVHMPWYKKKKWAETFLN